MLNAGKSCVSNFVSRVQMFGCMQMPVRMRMRIVVGC